MPVVSTIPDGPKGDVSFSLNGSNDRMATVSSFLDMSLELIVCVAPSSCARARRLGKMSTAIIVLRPRALDAYHEI